MLISVPACTTGPLKYLAKLLADLLPPVCSTCCSSSNLLSFTSASPPENKCCMPSLFGPILPSFDFPPNTKMTPSFPTRFYFHFSIFLLFKFLFAKESAKFSSSSFFIELKESFAHLLMFSSSNG